MSILAPKTCQQIVGATCGNFQNEEQLIAKHYVHGMIIRNSRGSIRRASCGFFIFIT